MTAPVDSPTNLLPVIFGAPRRGAHAHPATIPILEGTPQRAPAVPLLADLAAPPAVLRVADSFLHMLVGMGWPTHNMTPVFTFVNTSRPLPCEVVAHLFIAMTAGQLRMGRRAQVHDDVGCRLSRRPRLGGWSLPGVWSRGLCNTLLAEGFWGGHVGPWFHREQFGLSFWDNEPDENNNNAILRAKWSGQLMPSLYCNPQEPDCDPDNTGP